MAYEVWEHEDGRYTMESGDMFEVYDANDNLLGTIYPADIEDHNRCREALEAGDDPIADGREDGLGNSCSKEGWGKEASRDEHDLEL